MNWLEQHLRNFVLPVIKSKMSDGPIIPFTGKLNPANNCQWPETGMLKAALKSWGLKSTRYVDHPMQGISQSTLDQFVKFDLTKLGISGHSLILKESQLAFSQNQVFHSIIKNSVKSLRDCLKPGTKLLLLGRDVWSWAILCQKYNVPYVFDPRVSRATANDHELFAKLLQEIGAKDGDTMFDTGFAGTIHRHAQAATGLNLVNLMLSSGNNDFQQFRNNGLIRNRALFAEYLPKYYKSGYVKYKHKEAEDIFASKWVISDLELRQNRLGEREIVQPYRELDEFVQCALTTIWLYNFESPAWIPGPSYIKQRKASGIVLPSMSGPKAYNF
jgi:hypothetical protein